MGQVIKVGFRKAAPEAAKRTLDEGEIDRFPTRAAFEAFRRKEIEANPYGELIGQRLEAHRLGIQGYVGNWYGYTGPYGPKAPEPPQPPNRFLALLWRLIAG